MSGPKLKRRAPREARAFSDGVTYGLETAIRLASKRHSLKDALQELDAFLHGQRKLADEAAGGSVICAACDRRTPTTRQDERYGQVECEGCGRHVVF